MAAQVLLDYIVQAFTLYVDGFGKAGSGEKCSLPKIKKVTEKFRGGGMLAARNVAMGYDAFQISYSLSAFDPQVLSKGGLYVGNKTFSHSIRGYLDGDSNAQHTVVFQSSGEIAELDPGDWDAGKKAMLKATVDLISFTLSIDSAVVWDVDVANGKYNFGGTDPYAAISAALGF